MHRSQRDRAQGGKMLAKTDRRGATIVRRSILATVLALATAQGASGAVTPEQKCEGGKNLTAGKYAACLAKAQMLYVGSGDSAAYMTAVSLCETKLASKWGKLELGATQVGTVCPSQSDATPITDFVDACSSAVAEALSGGTLLQDVVS